MVITRSTEYICNNVDVTWHNHWRYDVCCSIQLQHKKDSGVLKSDDRCWWCSNNNDYCLNKDIWLWIGGASITCAINGLKAKFRKKKIKGISWEGSVNETCIHDSRVCNFHESVIIGNWRTLLSFLFLSCTLSLGTRRMAGTLQMRCQDSDSHNESFQRLVATVSPYSTRVHFVTLDCNVWTLSF